MQYRLELAGIEMPPAPLFTVIPAAEFYGALRSTPRNASRMVQPYADAASLDTKFNSTNPPRRL